MRFPFWILLVCAGCSVRVVPPTTVSSRLERADSPDEVASAPPVAPVPVLPGPEEEVTPVESSPAPGELLAEVAPVQREACPDSGEPAEGEDDDVSGPEEADEGESTEASAEAVPGLLYTAELSEEELARRWKEELASLGSVAVGFVHSGRLVNGVRFPQPEKDEWIVVSPALSWATEETISFVTQAIRRVRELHPDAPPLRVNQISSREGGYLRPHKSHQNGRDVDLGFYYPTAEPVRVRERERYIEPALNWALIKALVTGADVQMILVDRRVQDVLYAHALKIGEDKAWLDSLFHAGANSLIKHARRHRDHFHVRFYNARAQELGRRVAPLLAMQPEYNVVTHRVRYGDTLGGIALRYNASMREIQRANRMRGSFLRVGQRLKVPLRGPCTRCPVPPPVVVPPRRLPAEKQESLPSAGVSRPCSKVGG